MSRKSTSGFDLLRVTWTAIYLGRKDKICTNAEKTFLQSIADYKPAFPSPDEH